MNSIKVSIETEAITQSTYTPQSLNKEKIAFASFYHYLSKFEIQIAELEVLLYWTSLSECFFFLLGVIIYAAHPATLDFLWIFIWHLFRAMLGCYFLIILPRTYQAIETISIPSNISVDALELQMKTLYKSYFSRQRTNIRVVFVVYFILTIICNSVNDWALIGIIRILCVGKFKLRNLLTIGFVIVYYFCNGVYFSWFSTIRTTMPVLSKFLFRVIIGEIKTFFGLFRRLRPKKKINEELKPLDNTSDEQPASSIIGESGL